MVVVIKLSYKEKKISNKKQIEVNLCDDTMPVVQQVADLLDMTVENMAYEAVLAFAYDVKNQIREQVLHSLSSD